MAWTADAPTKSGAYWAVLRLGQEPVLLYINSVGLLRQFGTQELLSFYSDVYCWWDEEVKSPAAP